jgi:hypothetical protein
MPRILPRFLCSDYGARLQDAGSAHHAVERGSAAQGNDALGSTCPAPPRGRARHPGGGRRRGAVADNAEMAVGLPGPGACRAGASAALGSGAAAVPGRTGDGARRAVPAATRAVSGDGAPHRGRCRRRAGLAGSQLHHRAGHPQQHGTPTTARTSPAATWNRSVPTCTSSSSTPLQGCPAAGARSNGFSAA